MSNIAGSELTGSWYVRRDENKERQLAVLGRALNELVAGYKNSLNFRELLIVELLFYCQLNNRDISGIVKIDNNSVAVIKHRCLDRIRSSIARSDTDLDLAGDGFESVLTDVWEAVRPSCPKRSTIGAYMLDTLEAGWENFVDMHLNTLGCHFCRANLDDLKTENEKGDQIKMQTRIMESTVGFLKKN